MRLTETRSNRFQAWIPLLEVRVINEIYKFDFQEWKRWMINQPFEILFLIDNRQGYKKGCIHMLSF